MRKILLANNSIYHVYNRGVDKRNIFIDNPDFERFLLGMQVFNSTEPIGSIYELNHSRPDLESKSPKKTKLVEIVAYCLNQNHYHFLLRQKEDNGISKFMQKLGIAYTMYFNEKYERSGSLFQGTFKASHIIDNSRLLSVSAYVNLNFRIHRLSVANSKSSWNDYLKNVGSICDKDIIIGQYKKIEDYKDFALSEVERILQDRKLDKESDEALTEFGV